MQARRLLLVVSSPSGGGKTTICDNLLEQDEKLSRSISVTTRPERGKEEHGREYHFVSEDKFEKLIKANRFLEWAKVHSYKYGTLKSEVIKKHKQGQDVLLIIDVQGALSIKQNYPEAILIFLQPPSLKVLEQRLRGRGTDSNKAIAERLRNAKCELKLSKEYDYQVISHSVEYATEKMQAIITAERLREIHPSIAKRKLKSKLRLYKKIR